MVIFLLCEGWLLVVGSWVWKVSHLTKNIKNKFYKISYTVEIVSKTNYQPPNYQPTLFSIFGH